MQDQRQGASARRCALLVLGAVFGLVCLLGLADNPVSAAEARYPLGSAEAADAMAFDPFNPQAMLPEDPQDPNAPAEPEMPVGEEWLDLLPPGMGPFFGPPPAGPSHIFVPSRPPAASPIR